jgi:zinc protease
MTARHAVESSVGRVVSVALAVAVILIGPTLAFAQSDSTRPAVGPERPFQLAQRADRTLPNGLRVVVAQQNSVPKVTATLTVMAGLANDPADLAGLASITGEAIQEGTKSRTSAVIRHQAFAMGGSLSATSVQDYTSLSIRGLSEFTPGLLDLLADVAINPTLPEQEIGILKQQRLQAIAQERGSPQFLSNWEFRRALFGSHPYARVTATRESIQAIDRAKIEGFHRSYFRPNNAFLIVVGAVDPAQTMTAVEKAFGVWQRGDVPKVAFTAPPPLVGRQVFFVQRPNSVQSSISIGNFAIRRSDPRWFEMTLTNSIFAGAFNSRVVRNIREEKGYTYSPSSQLGAFGDAGFYRFAADVRNEVTGPTLSEVFKEVDAMRAEGSRGEELAGGKQYLRGLFAIQTATQAGLSGVLNTVYAFGLPKDYPETFGAKIAAVTPAQVREAAAGLLGSDNSLIVIVGDFTKVKDQLSGFKNITFVDVNGQKIAPPQ